MAAHKSERSLDLDFQWLNNCFNVSLWHCWMTYDAAISPISTEYRMTIFSRINLYKNMSIQLSNWIRLANFSSKYCNSNIHLNMKCIKLIFSPQLSWIYLIMTLEVAEWILSMSLSLAKYKERYTWKRHNSKHLWLKFDWIQISRHRLEKSSGVDSFDGNHFSLLLFVFLTKIQSTSQ